MPDRSRSPVRACRTALDGVSRPRFRREASLASCSTTTGYLIAVLPISDTRLESWKLDSIKHQTRNKTFRFHRFHSVVLYASATRTQIRQCLIGIEWPTVSNNRNSQSFYWIDLKRLPLCCKAYGKKGVPVPQSNYQLRLYNSIFRTTRTAQLSHLLAAEYRCTTNYADEYWIFFILFV
jgi:hypothetical protein